MNTYGRYLEVLIKIQPDATVCKYLFTVKSLYMFRVSQRPSSGVLKTVTAASGTCHNIGRAATSLQLGLIGSGLHNTCEISYPLHLLPPQCIQPKKLEYSCLLSFHLSAWRWQLKVPKHVVVLQSSNPILLQSSLLFVFSLQLFSETFLVLTRFSEFSM
jgi:hypothetical protein